MVCKRCAAELPDWRSSKYCRTCLAAKPGRPPPRKQPPPEYYERRRQRDREQWQQARRERAAGRKCIECDGPMPAEHDLRRITCSDQCRLTRDNRKAREYYYQKSGGSPQGTEASSKRMSDAKKQWWSEGHKFKDRACRACNETFTPNSPPQRYCSPECKKYARLSWRYGVPAAEIKQRMERQGACCAICGTNKPGWMRATQREAGLVFDHCHATGVARGFLCAICNVALGQFDDDPVLLRRAADYIEGKLD